MIKKIFTVIMCVFMVTASVIPQNTKKVYALDNSMFEESGLVENTIDYPTTTDIDFDISNINLSTEVISERTADTKTFRRVDGTYVLAVYDSNVHYEDNGEWKEIDNSLMLDSETDSVMNKSNKFKIKFPNSIDDNKKFKLSLGDYEIDWSVDSIEKTNISYEVTESKAESMKDLDGINQSVLYEDIQGNVNLEYILNGTTLKENIVLEKYIEDFSISFTYNLKNLSIVEESAGNYVFVNEANEVVMSFDSLYMIDDNGDVSEDVQISVKELKKGEYQVIVTPNDDFLSKATYPVKIDPSLTFDNGASMIQDKYVWHTNSSNNNYLKVGLYDYFSYYYRSYMEFDLTVLPDDIKVDYAHLTLNSYDNNIVNDGTVVAKEVKSTYTYSGINAELQDVTESREIDYENVMYAYGDSRTYSFDLTYVFEKWVDNGESERSIELRRLDESEDGYIIFHSNNTANTLSPKLEVGYTFADGIKDFWTYNTQDLGKIGTGYISDYTGYLTFIRDDFSFVTEKQTLGLSFAFSNQTNDVDNGYGNGWNPSYNTFLDYDNDVGKYFTVDYTGNKTYYQPLDMCPSQYAGSYPYNNVCAVSEDGSGKVLVHSYVYSSLTSAIVYDRTTKYMFDVTDNYLYKIANTEYSQLYTLISRNSSDPKLIDYVKDASGNYLRFVYDSYDKLDYILLRTAAIEAGDPNMINGDYLEKTKYVYSSGNVYKVYHYNNFDEDETNDNCDIIKYLYTSNRLRYAYIYGEDKIIYTYGLGNDKVTKIENYFYNEKFSEVTYDYSFRQTRITDHSGSFVLYKFDEYGHTVNIIDRNANTVYYQYRDIFNETSTDYNYYQNHELLSQSVPEKMNYNAVENNNFENSFSNDYWQSSGYIAPSQSTTSYLGDYSLYTYHYTSTGGYMYQNITLGKGVYSLVAMVKNNSSSDTGAYISVDNINSDPLESNSGWQEVYVPINIENDNTQITIKLHNHSYGGVYFDNIRIVSGINDSRINIVENASFEFDGTKYWNSVNTSYVTYYLTNDQNNDVSNLFETILSGHSIGIEGSPTEIREVSQTIDAAEFTSVYGGTFYIGGWANTYLAPLIGNTNYDSDKVFRIYVEFYDGSNVVQANEVCFDQNIYSWQYVYGEFNAPTNYDEVKIAFQYQGLGEVIVDGLNVFFQEDKTVYEHDELGRVTSIDFGDGRTYTYHYPDDETYIPDSVTDENNNVTSIEDNNGELEYVIKDNIKSTPTYNNYGQVEGMQISGKNSSGTWIDYFDTSTTYACNSQYISTTTNEFDKTTTYSTDEVTGLMEYIKDARNVKTQYEYYDNGLLYRVYIGESITGTTPYVKYVYDSKDRLIEIELDENYSYYIHYDIEGRMDYVKVNDQQLMSYTYIIENGLETHKIEDQTYGNGDTITYSYNEDDQIENIYYSDSQYTDQLRFTYSYDSYGRLAIYEDVINGITEYYEYDFSGNLHRITNNLDEEIIYDYDDQNNLSGITYNFDNETSITVYNHQSGIDFKFYDYTTFNNGSNTIKKDYNYEEYGLRRLEEVEFLRNGIHELYLNYEYDGDTTRIKQITYNIASSTSCDIAYRYSYDSVGNITKEQYYEDGSILVTKDYLYDDFNQLIKEDSRDLTYSASSYEPTNYTKYYHYDLNGNITDVKSYKYGENEYNTYTVPYFKQTNSGMGDAFVVYNSNNYYDDIYCIDVNQNVYISFDYLDMSSFIEIQNISTSLLYSNLDNTTEGYYYNYYKATDNLFYTLYFRIVFKVGNPLNGENPPEEYVSHSYDSDWKDQLESYTILKDGTTSTSQITYDNQGNPTQITNFEYKDSIYTKAELDWEGRNLINIKVYNSSLAVMAEIDYTYNDQGIRIEKIIDDSIGKIKYEYKLSGSQLHAEIKSEYDNVNEEWDILYKMIYSYDYDGSYIGFTYVNSSGYRYDYMIVTNIQGDVTHILNRFGNEVVHYEYDAYGNIIDITGSEASTTGVRNSLRYRSYFFDSETSLYYLNSRYYNPEIARFISSDGLMGEIGNVQSNNLFAYCLNNPVMYSDISGEFPILITCIIVGAIIGGTIGGVFAYNNGQDVLSGILTGAVIGGAVGAVVGLGSVSVLAGLKSVAHKAVADYTAYALYGKSFGGIEDYAVAFAFGGLTKGLGISGITKLTVNSVGRALVDQGTEMLLHGEDFNLGKFGVDVFRRSFAQGLPSGSQAFFKGVISGAYDQYSKQGYVSNPLMRIDYSL